MKVGDLRHDPARAGDGRGSSAVLAAIGAVAMLTLTVVIFTVTATARHSVDQSSRVHHLDRLALATANIRTQLEVTTILTALDDEASTALAARSDADDAIGSFLAEIETSRRLLDDAGDGLGPETDAALDRYLVAVARHRSTTGEDDAGAENASTTEGSSTADAGGSPGEAEVDHALDTALDGALETVRLALGAEREVAVAAVGMADDRLVRLSTIVGALNAVVLASLAVAIHRLLSGPGDEATATDPGTTGDSAATVVRRAVLMNRLDLLGRLAAKAAPSSDEPNALTTRVEELRRTFLSLERSQHCVLVDVEVLGVVQQVAVEHAHDLVLDTVGDEGTKARTDPQLLHLLLTSLVADGIHRGAVNARVTLGQNDDHISIALQHDGDRRTPTECELIADRPAVAERTAHLSGPDVNLVAALYVTDELQGTMTFGHGPDDQQTLIVQLPAAPPRPPSSTADMSAGVGGP